MRAYLKIPLKLLCKSPRHVVMCDRGTRSLPDGPWKSTTGGRRPRQTPEAAKSHHSLSPTQGPSPRAALLPQTVRKHAALSKVQPQEGTCRSTHICSVYAFVHLQLHNPKRCSVFCVGTWDIQFLKVAINLSMGYSLPRVEIMVIQHRVRLSLSCLK